MMFWLAKYITEEVVKENQRNDNEERISKEINEIENENDKLKARLLEYFKTILNFADEIVNDTNQLLQNLKTDDKQEKEERMMNTISEFSNLIRKQQMIQPLIKEGEEFQMNVRDLSNRIKIITKQVESMNSESPPWWINIFTNHHHFSLSSFDSKINEFISTLNELNRIFVQSGEFMREIKEKMKGEDGIIDELTQKLSWLKQVIDVMTDSQKQNCYSSIVELLNQSFNIATNLKQMISLMMKEICPIPISQSLKFAIRSKSSSAYLDGRSNGMSELILTNRNPINDHYLNWTLEPVNERGYFAIKSVSSGGFIDGRSSPMSDPIITYRDPFNDVYLQWLIEPTNDPSFYSIKSRSSNGYLDGRNDGTSEPLITYRDPKNDAYLQWQFVPVP